MFQVFGPLCHVLSTTANMELSRKLRDIFIYYIYPMYYDGIRYCAVAMQILIGLVFGASEDGLEKVLSHGMHRKVEANFFTADV